MALLPTILWHPAFHLTDFSTYNKLLWFYELVPVLWLHLTFKDLKLDGGSRASQYLQYFYLPLLCNFILPLHLFFFKFSDIAYTNLPAKLFKHLILHLTGMKRSSWSESCFCPDTHADMAHTLPTWFIFSFKSFISLSRLWMIRLISLIRGPKLANSLSSLDFSYRQWVKRQAMTVHGRWRSMVEESYTDYTDPIVRKSYLSAHWENGTYDHCPSQFSTISHWNHVTGALDTSLDFWSASFNPQSLVQRNIISHRSGTPYL